MAAISSLTVPFTKAFLVKHQGLSARVEFLFDRAKNSLRLNRVNLWENKESVHLTIPLADENIPGEETFILYFNAVELIRIWCKQFPTEKKPDGTYESMQWDAKWDVQVHSAEEAFLYWMLCFILPENDSAFSAILPREGLTREQMEFMYANAERIVAIVDKKKHQYPMTQEELDLVGKARFCLPVVKNWHSDPTVLSKMLNEFRKLRFPEILKRDEIDIEVMVAAARKDFGERVKLYANALGNRPSTTKVNDVD